MSAPSVRLEGAGVRFLFDRQQQVVTPTLAKLRRRGTSVWGVRDVDLEIAPGESVALIGHTGSGKTTLLRLLASVLFPDAGRVEVRGRVGSLLSTQAGLHPILTGRENATLLGVLAGLSRQESRGRLERVKEQSGLGDAFERAVSSYSQGMRARLGFAVAESARPQVLLLDEVHEAVDRDYHRVIDEHARAICDGGGIVAAAGHDHAVLGRLCRRAVLFKEGRIQADGPFQDVLADYV